MRWPLTRRAPAKGADDDQTNGGTGSLLRFLLLLAFFAWTLRSFVVAPFSIPSGSMLPTLYIGDYLMVAKWPYGYSRYSFPFGFPSFEGRLFESLPKRGDVVVFRHPSENIDLIKRVIALPGDTVAVEDGGLPVDAKTWQRSLKPVQELSPGTPKALCDLIHRCLSYNAHDRPERVSEIQGALDHLVEQLATSPEDRLEMMEF